MLSTPTSRIATKLKEAFVRLGFDVDSSHFDVELRSIVGTNDAKLAVEFLTGESDIALSILLSLCNAISVPLSEIVGGDDRETLQIFDYFGSNPAFIKLPLGLAWNRELMAQRLFYTPAPDETCGDINEKDFLILSRDCTTSKNGEIFMIETDQKLMLRRYVGIDSSGLNMMFSPNLDAASVDIRIPVGVQSVITEGGSIAAMTGKLHFNLRSTHPC